MKTTTKILITLLASALAFTGCVRDVSENAGRKADKGKATVQLRVTTSAAATRAAGEAERDVDANEGVLDDKVYVFVFKDTGELEHFSRQVLIDDNGAKKTGTFDLTAGDKYFYVISDPKGAIKVDNGYHLADFYDLYYGDWPNFFELIGIDQREEFETLNLYEDANFRYGVSDVPLTADYTHSDHGFVNMTLWGVKQTVTATTGTIDAEVGRLVGKVSLNEKPSGFSTKMAGEWDDFRFMVGSVSSEYYLVGQYEGPTAPPATGHGRVTSYNHNTTYGIAAFSPEYSKFKGPYTDSDKNCFYINENTSARINPDGGTPDPNGKLYYGCTTYILFAATYTPDETEYHSHLDVDQTGAEYKHTDGKSFYTATVNGQTLVFGDVPVSTMEGLDENSIKFYENGINYFHFPIRDRKESAIEDQCRVLRNHWYDVTIASIDRFGDHTTAVDPKEPIEEETEMDVVIKVLQWAKISQGEDL